MNFRHGTNRAADSQSVDEPATASGTNRDDGTDSTATETPPESDPFSDDQVREWRRWVVETFLTSQYAVVPIDCLVEEIVDREPENVDRSTVRAALTEHILPALDRESVLEYDADRELLINYGDYS